MQRFESAAEFIQRKPLVQRFESVGELGIPQEAVNVPKPLDGAERRLAFTENGEDDETGTTQLLDTERRRKRSGRGHVSS